MVATARPLTSTGELAGAVELRCPAPSPRGDGTPCNRLLGKAAPTTAPCPISLVCPRCHQHTTFEVPARG